jgi:hypothetical protein
LPILGVWFKKCGEAVTQSLWDTDAGAWTVDFSSGDLLQTTADGGFSYKTTQVFRDPNAWYHVVFSYDSDQEAEGDRWLTYLNGKLITDFSAYDPGRVTSGEAWEITVDATAVTIGSSYNGLRYWDGYMSQCFLVDGTSIQNGDYSIASFGEFNNNVWRPIDLTGLTFGTNGYLLDFADSSALGNDVSGNDNDWSTTNIDAADQVSDTPTTNYCILSPIDSFSVAGTGTLSNGSLTWSHTNTGGSSGTMVMTGKTYWETTCNASVSSYVGIIRNLVPTSASAAAQGITGDHTGFTFYNSGGAVYKGATLEATYATWASGDVMGCAYDPTVPDVEFFKNNVSQGSIALDAGDDYQPWVGCAANTCNVTANFGQTAFTYTPPTGFKAINTDNLSEPTIKNSKKYFDTILYEGNGMEQKTGQFQPITETYSVGNSALFIDADNCFLSRTPGSAGNRRNVTISFWFKRVGDAQEIIWSSTGGSFYFEFLSGGYMKFFTDGSGEHQTSQPFNDKTQWTNCVMAYDTENDAAADRFKLYINGVRITDFSTETNMTEDTDLSVTNNVEQFIGRYLTSASIDLDCYMAEFVLIDGTTLDASSFGEVDSTTNRWIPKDVSGLTFGTTGFYLDFADKNDLGDDESGNGNDWAESGFDTTNGSNQFYDTPTRNFAILDPGTLTGTSTVAGGNLIMTASDSGNGSIRTNTAFGLTSGKWYFEFLQTNGTTSQRAMFVTQQDVILGQDQHIYSKTGHYSGYMSSDGDALTPGDVTSTTGESTTYGTTYESGDVICCALDLDIGAIWWGKNGTWQNSATEAEIEAGNTSKAAQTGMSNTGSDKAGAGWYPTPQNGDTYTTHANFGQHIYYDSTTLTLDTSAGGYFRHAVPDGFKAINVDNLTESDSFQSAFCWIKNRDATDNHMLFDRVRGPFSFWHSNDDADIADDVDTLTRFLKQGATFGDDVRVNTKDESYLFWDWFIEATGSGSSNEDGSINTAATLVDTTCGFSISKFEGTGANATVGHGLGVAPKFFILKHFDNSNYSTTVWHNALPVPTLEYLILDTMMQNKVMLLF